jgi:hypothetical protein
LNIKGVKTKEYFEVIDIMDDLDLCHALLGIDWAFNNNVVLNLKKQHISFEMDTLCVIVPLDPNEGDKYNNPTQTHTIIHEGITHMSYIQLRPMQSFHIHSKHR